MAKVKITPSSMAAALLGDIVAVEDPNGKPVQDPPSQRKATGVKKGRKRKGRPYPADATVVNVHCPKRLVAELKFAAFEEDKTMHDYILDLLTWDQEQGGRALRLAAAGEPGGGKTAAEGGEER